jgi:hypothetical protein
MKIIIVIGVVLIVIFLSYILIDMLRLSKEIMKQCQPLTKDEIKILSDEFVKNICS